MTLVCWGRSMYSAFPGNGIVASPISLLSMGGVCGRSLTPGKFLFAGRQTCSLYLALWFMTLCFQAMHIFSVQKSNPLPLQIFIGWQYEDCSYFVTLEIYITSWNSAFIHHFQIEIFNNKCKNTRKINFNFTC